VQPFRPRVIVPIMGKHSRRKSGYLPKIAAGAAPVAFLFAAPAAALASPAELTLPLDHRHTTTLDNDGDSLFASRRDVVVKQLGDARLASDLTEAVATRGDRAGAVERSHQGVWLAQDVDVLSENAEQLDAGLFAGDLTGGIAARHSSGQAVDAGQLGAVGTASDLHAIGSLSGDLDVSQEHELGGQLGPASGLVKTSLSQSSGSFSGDLGVDHVVHVQGGTTSLRGTLAVSVLDQPVLGF
jgi:hypothetical protein